jgi:LuxR family transcriptional regulator, maltose regulon positive regulatory protein
VFTNILATTGLGMVQEMETQLVLANRAYQDVLKMVGEPVQPAACEACLGLARLHYEWNVLDKAEQYGKQGIQLSRQIEGIDTAVAGEVFLARLTLARGNVSAATQALAQVAQTALQHQFAVQIPKIVALQVRLLLQQGNVEAATTLVQQHTLPLSEARVYLAQGDVPMALSVLESYRQQIDAKNWYDEQLKVMVLQAAAKYQNGDAAEAINALADALALAAPGGFVRTFVDEDQPMQRLLVEAVGRGVMPQYTRKLLAAFQTEPGQPEPASSQPLIEPLSERELEILGLVAEGLSNRDISERLFLALSTVKGHNRNIFDKLQVKRRTEAVARARVLSLI